MAHHFNVLLVLGRLSRDGINMFVKMYLTSRDEGVPQLSLGEKANLICSPDYGKSATNACGCS